MFKTLFSLPRTVWLIALVSLVNDAASDMLYPLIPLYLSSVLMAGPRALGLIEGVAEATTSLLRLFSGVLVDKTRRSKPWIVTGYFLAGIGRPLVAFVGSWGWVLVIRFSDRVGKGLRSSPRDALLADSVAPDQRGLAFGFHRAMDNTGAVIGPLLAWWLLARGVHLHDLFLWSWVPAILCLGLAMMIPDRGGHVPKAPTKIDWNLGSLPPGLRRYLGVIALFSLGNSSNMFLLLRARELGVLEADIPLLWALLSAVAALFCTPLAALSDRVGRIRLLVVGYLAYGIFYAAMGLLNPGLNLLFGLFAFYGLFMAATEGVERAMVADFATPEQRGTAFGWFNLLTGAMLLPASLIFGALYQVAPTLAFGFSASCALGALALLLLLMKRNPAVR